MDKEDACFHQRKFNSFSDLDYTDTVQESGARAFPVPNKYKGKQILRTNAASKLLGFSVLLDPMGHDKIDCMYALKLTADYNTN